MAVGLVQLLPTSEDVYHPFTMDGERDKTVHGGTFTVKTVDPIFAKRVSYDDGFGSDPDEQHTLTTNGVWLVVPVSLAATEEPLSVEGVELRTEDGRSYAPTRRLPSSHDPGLQRLEPGVDKIGAWAFEIRPAQADGATLYLSESANPELTPQVRIPLGVESGDADRPEKRFGVPEVVIPR